MVRRALLGFLALAAIVINGCGKPETRVQEGNRLQVLHRGNGTEPQELDPHIATGVPEHFIISSLFEGLVSEDARDLHAIPGVAERWDISDDGKLYTFHLRLNAKWSNGEPVTAHDFVRSYKRMLAPTLAAEYAYMLYVMKNAEDYHKGKLADFAQVGCTAINDSTLRIELNGPTPYFLALLNHYSWYPVHIPTVEKHGSIGKRGNRWTLPGNFVGNGTFVLSEWTPLRRVVVKRSPTYWDRDKVRLNEIRFYAMESLDSEERAFRAGQIHMTYEAPLPKIHHYRKTGSSLLRIDPYLGTYYYRINVTRPHLKDPRVRRALAMATDRESIAAQIRGGGELPAYALTPPGTAGYTSEAKIETNVEAARKLMAEAGYPNGKGFPKLQILFNTHEAHKAIAEAVQQMWKINLNIDVELVNQEWKVYLDAMRRLDYDVARSAWIGDYVDPSSFIEMFITGGGNNRTGWSNKEYDRLVTEAALTGDTTKRFALFQKAETILLDEAPLVPVYHYVHAFFLQPSVKGWNPNILDRHPYKDVYLEETK